jgi:hypothetical protein
VAALPARGWLLHSQHINHTVGKAKDPLTHMCVCPLQMLLPLLRELRCLRSAMSDGAAVEPAHLLRLHALLQQVGVRGTCMGSWGTTSSCS